MSEPSCLDILFKQAIFTNKQRLMKILSQHELMGIHSTDYRD